jgi:2-keto-4-pentenoate hydratase/2-oxohepta-3-ene-1,7-dioic acid hydratase in catechol pathway
MRLASYRHGNETSWGVVTEQGILDAGTALGQRFPTLRALLTADAIPLVASYAAGRAPDLARKDVAFLPVIPDPTKILCVGVNYLAHRQETGRAATPYPTLFTRFANTLVGHGASLIRPQVSTRFDYEAELAVIIGRAGRHIRRDRALDHVAGYACFNDATVRDWQQHTTQFTPGKNFVATGGFGPWMVTADEIPDPTKLEVILRLNGEEMQRSTTDLLIFDIPALIEYISTFTELVSGDVIATGTPGGVGWKRDPPVFLRDGDVAEVEVRGVGVLRNPVAAEKL